MPEDFESLHPSPEDFQRLRVRIKDKIFQKAIELGLYDTSSKSTELSPEIIKAAQAAFDKEALEKAIELKLLSPDAKALDLTNEVRQNILDTYVLCTHIWRIR